MQSYKLHIVSEHLNKRHPYLDPPFNARYNKTEVYYAVFDRSIPKLIYILLMEGIYQYKYRDAFMTLNELASHENDKDSMITQGLIGISAAYIHCKNTYIRRYATLLLGSLLSTPRGLTFLDSQAYSGIEKLLFDEVLEVRKAVAWCVCRIVLSRAGVDLLCRNNIVACLIKSFLKYADGDSSKYYEPYVIYLLEALTYILCYDNGIQFALGTGLTALLNKLCQKNSVFSKYGLIIVHYLSLDNLSKIASNPQGKLEGIKENIIRTASNFLFSEVPQEVNNAVVLIMFTAIHLYGKKQCIYSSGSNKVDTEIIIKLINLLVSKDECLRKDVKECLKIIAQLKDGFLAITEYMAREGFVEYLEEIFASTVVVSLAELLPTTSQLEAPPMLPSLKVPELKSFAKALCFFLNKYPDAIEIGLEETVDICLKLAPFLCFRGDRELQEGAAYALVKLVTRDNNSKLKFKRYLEQYGGVMHKTSQTTLEAYVSHLKKLHTSLNG